MSAELQPEQRKGRLHEERPAQQPPSDQDDEYHGEAAIDIIAVHGLGSKYATTWATKLKDGSRFYWLREKLGPDVPQARILGFEYGSEWYGDPAYTSLEECGVELLGCVIRDRQHHGRVEMCSTRRKRPIIFVAHSFGGLVVKQALVTAYERWKDADKGQGESTATTIDAVSRVEAANYRDFLCSVAGVIFLGTPHRGSSFSRWARAKMIYGSIMGQQSHPELLKVLKAHSEPLEKLQQGFETVCNDSRVLDIRPRCYRETRQVPLPPWIVVPAESAWLDNADNGALDANHMEMNTFQPGPDANYDKILSDIRLISSSASRSVTRRLERWKYGSIVAENDRNVVEHWLDASRKPQIQHLHGKLACQRTAPYTCGWLQELKDYGKWVSKDTRKNVLWIHGKPASGKSVLAAYLIDALSNASEAQVASRFSVCNSPRSSPTCGSKVIKSTVLYFFCDVDQSRDKPVGVLGTLIHQLLSAHDTDEVMFARVYQWKEKTPTSKVDASTILRLLQELLSLVVGNVFIVVDGLDDNPYGTDVVKALLAIAAAANSTRLVLFSQRRESLRDVLDSNLAVMNLSVTDYTRQDIDHYVKDRTLQMLDRRSALEPKGKIIIQKLQTSSQGMFEFVNMTLHNIENHIADIEDVDEYLDTLPSGLIGVYEKIFTRLSHSTEDIKRRIRTALQILTVTAVPVSTLDLQTALRVSETMGKATKERIWWSETTAANASRELKLLLDSLVEIDPHQVAKLVHSSLRKTLLLQQEASWDDESHTRTRLWYQFTAAEAHLLLAQICVVVISETTLSQAHAFLPHRRPLVQHAWNYWAYHLRASGFTLASRHSRVVFDRMLRHVHQHTLSFLQALGNFTTNPLPPVLGGKNYTLLEYRQSLQRAQGALTSAINCVCATRQAIPIAAKLHESRERVPQDLTDVSAETYYEALMKKTRSAVSELRARVVKDKTQVERVRLDALVENTPIGKIFQNETHDIAALLDASRSLRLLALSLAVNPIYTILTQKVNTHDFSPINLLVDVAQLFEEAASFPYWQHFPAMLNAADAFVCGDADPQAKPAKFVLQSLHRQRHNTRLESPPNLNITNTPPDKLVRELRELTEVKGSRWIATRYALHMIGAGIDNEVDDENGLFRTMVITPLVNLRLKEKFFVVEANDGSWPMFLNPQATLDLTAPTSLRDKPVKEVIAALPSLLKFVFIQYIMALLHAIAEIPRASLVAHYIQLTVSRSELIESARHFKQLYQRRPLVFRHLCAIVLLYFFRCTYFPLLGAHAMAQPWTELLLAYRHPAAYLNLQTGIEATFWLKYTILMRLYHAVGRACVKYSLETNPTQPHTRSIDILATFYSLLSIERNIFGISFTCAVLTAAAKVILYEPDNVEAISRLTYLFTLANLLGIFNMLAGAVLQQQQASFLQGLPVVILQFVVFFAAINYQRALLAFSLRVLFWVLWPVTAPLIALWKVGLHVYAPFLKFGGVVCFILVVFLAVDGLNTAIADPHNFEGSRRAVQRALDNISSLRDKPESLVLGEFPLGSKGEAPALTGLSSSEEDDDDSWIWPEDTIQDDNEDSPSDRSPPDIITNDMQTPAPPGAAQQFGDILSAEFENAVREIIQLLENARAGGFTGFGRNSIDSNTYLGNQQGSGWRMHIGQPQLPNFMRNYPRLPNFMRNDLHLGRRMDDWHTQNNHLGTLHSLHSSSAFDTSDQMPWRSMGPMSRFRDQAGAYQQGTTTTTTYNRREVHESSSWNFNFNAPGSTLSYSSTHSGPPRLFEKIFSSLGLFFIAAVWLYIIWTFWWLWTTPSGSGSSSAIVRTSCWHFGIPLGYIYVGYGCDGFIFEVLGFRLI